MPRLHDETILETIWKHHVVKQVLEEDSVLSQFFTPEVSGSKKYLKTLHKDIGISADTAPIIPIKLKTVSGTANYLPRGKFDSNNLSKLSWIRKQDEIQNHLQRGDGIFIFNPGIPRDMKLSKEDDKIARPPTRVIIRQKLTPTGWISPEAKARLQKMKDAGRTIRKGDVKGIRAPSEDPYLQSDKRETFHVPFRTTYKIWVLTPSGEVKNEELRHLTGTYEDQTPKPEDSNLWVSYIDRNASVYSIPNSAFRGKVDEPLVSNSIGIDDTGVKNSHNRAPIYGSRDIVDNIIKKYGEVIRNNIKKVLPVLGDRIKDVMTNKDLPEDLLKQVLDDLYAYRRLSDQLDSDEIYKDFRKFIERVTADPELRNKYNIGVKDDIHYLKPGIDNTAIRNKKKETEPNFNLFVRDFILSYMKKFSPNQFDKRFIQYMADVF